MSSVFTTPLGNVWVSNGQAEAILDGCVALAARRGLSGVVVDYLRETLTTSGVGCYGFDVVASPFDEPARRVVLGKLIAEFADVAGSGEPRDVIDVPWSELNPWIRADWVASLEQLHDGIRVSLPVDSVPIHRVHLDAPIRDAVEVHKILANVVPFRVLINSEFSDEQISKELEARRQALRIVDRLPTSLLPPFEDALRAEIAELERRQEFVR